ncbi:R-spondin-3 [Austrofundulus limnaeus]|uniref:R-spondin-3 n=1 Tax=Austrofundulus limnaeus TaxID=52670 RepID=A0A2I4BHZ7_AUSLI|nr:PREDICTED: R-spondin-3-like [Austrofundulus limnaeus]
MQISSWIWILHLMNLSKSQGGTSVLRWKRSSSVSSDCQAGCATCSALNGCLSCKPRFFFHLEVDGMRQRGTCLSSCPRGHYGTRSPQISTCTKCNADCASCFSENFCTRCHPGHFLFRGKCETSCPNRLTANEALRECIECPAGCELCTRKNVCTRCRANMYHHQGQCHHTCPKGFEPNMQLMECVHQSEKKTYFSDFYSSISTSAFLSLLYGFSSSLSGWRVDKLGSLCSEKGQVGPQEGRGNPHQTSPPLPKYLW